MGKSKKVFTSPSKKRARYVHEAMPHGTGRNVAKWVGRSARALKYLRHLNKSGKRNKSTQTQTYATEAQQYTQVSHGAAVISKCYHIGKEARKRVKDSRGKWKYIDDYSVTFTAVTGTQNHANLCSVGSLSSFLNDGGVAIDYQTVSNALFNQNPYLKITGGGRYAAGTTPADDRIILEKVRLHIVASNMNNTCMQGALHILMYKTSEQENVTQICESALAKQALGQPAVTFPTQAAPAALVAGVASIQVPFVNPLEQPMFRRYFKVVDVIPIHLDGGSTLNMHLDFKYNKLIDKAYLTETQYANIRNLTTVCYFVGHGGQSVFDSTNNKVTLSPCKMGFSIVREIHCHATEGKRVQCYEAAPNLITTTTDASTKLESIVDTVLTVASVF